MTPEQHADRALELSDAALTVAVNGPYVGAAAVVQALCALTHAVLAAVAPPQGEEGGDA